MRILRILFSLVIFGLIVHVLPTTTTPNVPVSAATNTSNVTAPAGNSTKNVNVTALSANTTQLALVSSASPETCKNGNGTHCPSRTISFHKDTPKYIGCGILIAFVIFHIFLYFYLEDQKAREQKKYFEELIAEQMAARKREEQDEKQHEDEEMLCRLRIGVSKDRKREEQDDQQHEDEAPEAVVTVDKPRD